MGLRYDFPHHLVVCELGLVQQRCWQRRQNRKPEVIINKTHCFTNSSQLDLVHDNYRKDGDQCTTICVTGIIEWPNSIQWGIPRTCPAPNKVSVFYILSYYAILKRLNLYQVIYSLAGQTEGSAMADPPILSFFCTSIPLHTWLPDTHGEARYSTCMLLARILLKMTIVFSVTAASINWSWHPEFSSIY